MAKPLLVNRQDFGRGGRGRGGRGGRGSLNSSNGKEEKKFLNETN
jgi:hypothetical protein